MIVEKLQQAVEDCLRRNDFEWIPDSETHRCIEVPPGETPYTHGQNLIESIADLVQRKRGSD